MNCIFKMMTEKEKKENRRISRRNWYDKNRERIREYERSKKKSRNAYKRKWYRNLSEKRKREVIKLANKWGDENPEERNASARRSRKKSTER